MKNILLALLFFVLCSPFSAHAHSFQTGGIEIGHPWAMPTTADAKTGAVYMGFMNMGDKPDQLVGASTSIAHSVQLYDGKGVVQSIDLPVKRGVALRPGEGAAYILLGDLKGGLVTGDKFTLRLTFAHAAPVDVTVMVEDHAAH